MKRLALLIACLVASPALAQIDDSGWTSLSPADGRSIVQMAAISNPNQVPAAVMQRVGDIVRVQGDDRSWGSGAYLGGGYVLTAAHVTTGSSWTIHFRDGFTSQATLQRADRTFDQAVLLMQRIHPTAVGVPLANANPQVGDHVTVAGFDAAEPTLLVRPGLVRGFVRPNGGAPADWFEIDNQVHSGSSGGPAFNESGELIGNLWGASPGTTVSVSCGRTRRLLEPFGGRLREWWQGVRSGQSPTQLCPGGICQPGGGYSSGGGRPTIPVQPGQTPIDSTPAPVPDPVAGPPGPPGPAGPTGPAGPQGPPGVCDDQAILLALFERIKNDPQFKGPKGDKGDAGEVDYEKLTQEIIARLPPVTIQYLDGNGSVVEEETFQLGQPIRIPALRVLKFSADGKTVVDHEAYPYPWGMRLRYGVPASPSAN